MRFSFKAIAVATLFGVAAVAFGEAAKHAPEGLSGGHRAPSNMSRGPAVLDESQTREALNAEKADVIGDLKDALQDLHQISRGSPAVFNAMPTGERTPNQNVQIRSMP